MTRTFDPVVERDASMWPVLAAAILGVQGVATLIYATFMPAPISSAGIDVPIIGTVPYIWIATGLIALTASAGVMARLSWSRYLGTVSAVITVMVGVWNAQTTTMVVVAFVLPSIVLFTLWKRWPSDSTVWATDLTERPVQAPAPNPASLDHIGVRAEDQAA